MVVRDIPDERLLEITLIENIQREDLNPIETAAAFARMGAELKLSPEEIGRRTGKDRTTIINFIAPAPTSSRHPATDRRPAPLRRPRPLPAFAYPPRNSSGRLPRRPWPTAGRCARPSASRKE